MIKPAVIKLIAALSLAIQVWAGGGVSSSMVCLRGLFVECNAPQTVKSCCKREHPGPAEPPHEKCPPNCGCCISVPPTDRNVSVVKLDLDRAVSFAATLYCTGFVPAFELAPAAILTGIPPPDRPHAPLCIESTRLII